MTSGCATKPTQKSYRGATLADSETASIYNSEPFRSHDGKRVMQIVVWGIDDRFLEFDSPVKTIPGPLLLRWRIVVFENPDAIAKVAKNTTKTVAYTAAAVVDATALAAAVGDTTAFIVIPPWPFPTTASEIVRLFDDDAKKNPNYLVRHTVEAGKSYQIKFSFDIENRPIPSVWLEEFKYDQ